MNARQVRVHLADPDFVAESCGLKFTLTYEGALKVGHGRVVQRKHEIRRAFHPQLKRLWQVNFLLANWVFPQGQYDSIKAIDRLKAKIEDFEFIPLVTKSLCVECALDFRVLRPTDQAGHISDIDNQVKIISDALKIPRVGDIKDGGLSPGSNEKPFFVLVQDDGLVTKISSINDELLAPICGKDTIDSTDVRVSIDVYIRPTLPAVENVIFFSEDRGAWDHKYDEAIPDSLFSLTNSQLRSLATQCIFRISAMAKAFESWRPRPSDDTDKLISDSYARNHLWRTELQPKAVAIKRELCRRIYGEGPYPSDRRSIAIESGMLAGVAPLTDAAIELDTLVRLLPP